MSEILTGATLLGAILGFVTLVLAIYLHRSSLKEDQRTQDIIREMRQSSEEGRRRSDDYLREMRQDSGEGRREAQAILERMDERSVRTQEILAEMDRSHKTTMAAIGHDVREIKDATVTAAPMRKEGAR